MHLPKFVIPITTLTVGYPADIPAQIERLPIGAILHHEAYQDYTPEAIHRLYFEKENLAENKKYIEENHKENLAQVFTDVRSPRKDNELFSKTFLDFIVKQGFRLPD